MEGIKQIPNPRSQIPNPNRFPMANKEHLKILKQGVEVWNKWRKDNSDIRPDLSAANMSEENLSAANLQGVDLSNAELSISNLSNADFEGADVKGVTMRVANLTGANFAQATLQDADLIMANFTNADFSGVDCKSANLSRTSLVGAKFGGTILDGANFDGAQIGSTTLVDVDLSGGIGLEGVRHSGPSSVGIDTLYKSNGKIPVVFLRGCGVPEDFITFIPSILGALEPIQFYSCFISYSTKDEEFARRLYSRMRDEKLRVWFAPEDMKGGELLHEQIEQAIQLHDRLLVVLSEESMASDWVKREIRNARRAEKRENRRKLFPIRLVDFDPIADWKGFEGDGAEDLAFELGKFYIPDFSNWKTDHDAFEREFAKLLRDLRAEEQKS
jgi:uncharacterized protein YjbI with pentapeptide repeats